MESSSSNSLRPTTPPAPLIKDPSPHDSTPPPFAVRPLSKFLRSQSVRTADLEIVVNVPAAVENYIESLVAALDCKTERKQDMSDIEAFPSSGQRFSKQGLKSRRHEAQSFQQCPCCFGYWYDARMPQCGGLALPFRRICNSIGGIASKLWKEDRMSSGLSKAAFDGKREMPQSSGKYSCRLTRIPETTPSGDEGGKERPLNRWWERERSRDSLNARRKEA
ncbi:hypothetical protein BDZ45DRAFT_746200 [Acephala macrosclerotiorum]|nr:hypothetical protein BDZ45DRAFT_746200 [Acephala macrosclerotiorum]